MEQPLSIRIETKGSSISVSNNINPRGDKLSVSTGLGLERIASVYKLFSGKEFKVENNGEVFRCVLPLLESNLPE